MSLDFDSARLSNPYLKSEHEEWRTQVRRFFDREVIPYAEEWDEEGCIPETLWPKAAEVGILGLGYPEKYGGIEEDIDIWHQMILNEELARAKALEAHVEQKKDQKRRDLNAIRNDPAYLELVARDRLDLYREGEKVYRIEEK